MVEKITAEVSDEWIVLKQGDVTKKLKRNIDNMMFVDGLIASGSLKLDDIKFIGEKKLKELM
ncbi:MAG: hypothetical protein ACE5KE_14545 [Methanosarcinales archaeon]